jgi:hypothetical protein
MAPCAIRQDYIPFMTTTLPSQRTSLPAWLSLAHLRDILLLLGFPLGLGAINSNWLFTHPIFLADPWFYLAYFRYLFAYGSREPSISYYWLERISVNYPGHVVHQLFEPLLANFVWHLLVYGVAVLGFYGLLCVLFNRRVALIAALLMGSYSWFLRAVGWDYVDGAGVAYFIVAAWCVALAAKQGKQWQWWLRGSGFAFMLAIGTQIFWVAYLPVLMVLFYGTKRPSPARPTQIIIPFFAGTALSYGLMSLIFYSITGTLTFLGRSVMFSFALSRDRFNTEDVIAAASNVPPYFHFFMFAAALFSILILLRKKSLPRTDFLRYRVFILFFTFSAGSIATLHLISTPNLRVFFYCSYIIPSIFIIFAIPLQSALSQLSARTFNLLAVGTAFVLTIPMLISVLAPALLSLQANVPLLLASMAMMVWLSLLLFTSKKAIPLLLIGFLLSANSLNYLSGYRANVYDADRAAGMDNYNLTIAAAALIDSVYPDKNFQTFRVWYATDEQLFTKINITAMYLLAWRRTINVPQYPPSEFVWTRESEVRQNDNILLLGRDDDLLAQAQAGLAPFGGHVRLEHVRTERLQAGSQYMNFVFTKAIIDPLVLAYDQPFDFDRPFEGSSWYIPETDAKNRTIVWTGPQAVSTLKASIAPPTGPVRLSLCITDSIEEIGPDFAIRLNDQLLEVQSGPTADCALLATADVPASVLANGEINLRIRSHLIISPRAKYGNTRDSRFVGMAIDWLRLDLIRQ